MTARYLEFHKIRYPGGLKLWAVTDSAADLADKQPYVPAAAREAAMSHAAHFQTLLDATRGDPGDHAIIAPFDTELFGHWWFEGMDFLKALYERDLANEPATNPGCSRRRRAPRSPRSRPRPRCG